jgi:hypothetical protein
MEVGLGVNVEKTKYMLLSHHQNVGQNCDTKITNSSFDNVSVQISGNIINKI